MCGIGGVFNADRQQTVDRQLLVNMAAIQAHRGPDGFGVEVLDQAGVGFCHARLAVFHVLTGNDVAGFERVALFARHVHDRPPSFSAKGYATGFLGASVYQYVSRSGLGLNGFNPDRNQLRADGFF